MSTEAVDGLVDTTELTWEKKKRQRSTSDVTDEGIYEPDEAEETEYPVPFLAIIQSMRPSLQACKRLMASMKHSVSVQEGQSLTSVPRLPKRLSEASHRSYVIDSFGFKVDISTDGVPAPFVEYFENKRKWLTCLEFSHTRQLGVPEQITDGEHGEIGTDESLWSRVFSRLTPSPQLTELIRGLPSEESQIGAIWTGVVHQPASAVGIPHSLRHQVWPRISSAFDKRLQASKRNPPLTYMEAVKASESASLAAARQIEKDLFRTMPSNVCFSSASATGISRLRRVLLAVAWLYVDIGYCQGLGVITANLLLFLEEEMAFWMMCSIIEDLLPPSYFSSACLIGVQADQCVLRDLVQLYLPKLHLVLEEHEIELALVTLPWFLTLFANTVSVQLMLRIWDLFFYEGSTVLFRLALAILQIKEEELISRKDSAVFFNILSNAPTLITDINELIQVAYSLEQSHLDLSNINSLRRHHLSRILVTDEMILSSDGVRSLPKQFLSKRQPKGAPSLLGSFFTSPSRPKSPQHALAHPGSDLEDADSDSSDLRSASFLDFAFCTRAQHRPTGGAGGLHATRPTVKNVRKTELLVDLKQAIIRIVRHFRTYDCNHMTAISQADYSLTSHGKDLQNYVHLACKRQRRVKAIADFEPQEEDELGFSRNDIITLLGRHDEHCWVGELNNKRGWFPATFVELLDERSKDYSAAGDDTVHPEIAKLVLGELGTTLRDIFEHGLKRSRILAETTSHPWHFIEEAAAKEVERDFSSVHSRLVLCRTFRLDEEGKVLSPEELLFRAVHSINSTHERSEAGMDAKFRALIVLGLNELVLHLWLETLCSCVEIANKWYYPWSFLHSPGWVQIKCELRVLTQFSFHLSPLLEKSANRNDSTAAEDNAEHDRPRQVSHAAPSALNRLTSLANFRGRLATLAVDDDYIGAFRRPTESAGDMLVKYHLFSWEL